MISCINSIRTGNDKLLVETFIHPVIERVFGFCFFYVSFSDSFKILASAKRKQFDYVILYKSIEIKKKLTKNPFVINLRLLR